MGQLEVLYKNKNKAQTRKVLYNACMHAHWHIRLMIAISRGLLTCNDKACLHTGDRCVPRVHANAGDSGVVVACSALRYERQAGSRVVLVDSDREAIGGKVDSREHPRPVDHPKAEAVIHRTTKRSCGSLGDDLGDWRRRNHCTKTGRALKSYTYIVYTWCIDTR